MRINKLALAMILLAGTSGASTAMATASSTSDAAVTPPNTQPGSAAAAVSQPEMRPLSPAPTATDSSAQQPADAAASASSIPAIAEPQSVATAPETASGSDPTPATQDAASSVPNQPQSDSNLPSPAVNTAAEAPSEPHPAGTEQDTDGQSSQQPTQTSSTADEPLFTPEQEVRIGELAKNYLLKHPELLIKVDQKLQKIQYDEQMKAMTRAVIQHQDELLNDKTVPAIGPEDAKVAVIEFFDYQCSVCARQAPVIQSLMNDNPQVRFIFREWPIFGYRWKPSFQAAETGLRIWQQKGAAAYIRYHNALFASDHIEGALTQKDVTKAASAAGAGKLKNSDMLGTLSRTDILAKNTGFQGTPGIIVIPLSGATAETVTVFPGGAMESMLQDAINKASVQAGY